MRKLNKKRLLFNVKMVKYEYERYSSERNYARF